MRPGIRGFFISWNRHQTASFMRALDLYLAFLTSGNTPGNKFAFPRLFCLWYFFKHVNGLGGAAEFCGQYILFYHLLQFALFNLYHTIQVILYALQSQFQAFFTNDHPRCVNNHFSRNLMQDSPGFNPGGAPAWYNKGNRVKRKNGDV